MTTPFRKVFRDFWRERTRTVLVVAAIALGIAAFSSVMSSYAILTRELDRGYLATNPASAVIRMDAIDDDLIRSILSDRSISAAEARRVISVQIKTGPIQWRTLILFVVKDYGDVRVSKLEREQGSWPPAKGELLIERDAFQVAHARIGDHVTVKLPSGGEQQLVISGSVHDVGQAQARMENVVYGYITLETLEQLGEQPYLDQLNILVAQDRFNEAHIREVANNIKKSIEERGHHVRRVDIPKPGKHPHSDLMGLLLLAMSTFGLFVLALSGILVVNLLTASMAAQVRQIGVMKAIGASRLQLMQMYLAQAILLGLSATIIAIPLGLLGSRLLCRYMAYFLNFDVNSFAVPLWVYLLDLLVGVVTPLLAAAYPVWKGTRVPVRVALSDQGMSANYFVGGRGDRWLASFSGNYRPFLLSLRNTFRRRGRIALTLLTLSAAGLFFMTAFNFRASLVNTLDRMFATGKFDLSVAFASPQQKEKVERAIRNTPSVTAFESWMVTEGSLVQDAVASHGSSRDAGLHDSGSEDDGFAIVALPADSKLLKPEIISGRGLSAGVTDSIVVNSVLAAKYASLRPNNIIKIRVEGEEKTYQVVGITREQFSPSVAYVPLSSIEYKHPGETNSLRLALARSDVDSIDVVKADLDKALEREGLRARSSSSKADRRYGFDQHMLMIYIFMIVMSVIIGGVGGLGLMTTMSVNVLERRREMGVLRAIGATSKTVGLIIVSEGLIVGLLSWLIAAVAAWPVSKFVGDALVRLLFNDGLDFVFAPTGLLIWLLVSTALGFIATLLPAWSAARVTVREALAYE